jgi:hypothetical protein
VKIGKNVSASGEAVQFHMPFNLKPEHTTALRLNSQRELLFKVPPLGWFNATEGCGLNPVVSQLHLITSCYNSCDENRDDCEIETYIKLHLGLGHTDEVIARADEEHEAQRCLEVAAQRANEQTPIPLDISRHGQMSISDQFASVKCRPWIEAELGRSGEINQVHAKSQMPLFMAGHNKVVRLCAKDSHGSSWRFGMCSDTLDPDFMDELDTETNYSAAANAHDDADDDDEGSAPHTTLVKTRSSSVQVRLSESGLCMLHKADTDWVSTPLSEELVNEEEE